MGSPLSLLVVLLTGILESSIIKHVSTCYMSKGR